MRECCQGGGKGLIMRAHENPFRSDRVESLLFREKGVHLDSLLKQLDEHNGRGSLVGPKGSGKTTLLLELADAISQRGLSPRIVRLNSGGQRFHLSLLRDMDGKTALLLDGAEQLPLYMWWYIRWLARKLPYFVTTSHVRTHLPLLHRHQTSPELLRMLVSELYPDPLDVVMGDLYARHGGNIRECLRELYDIVGA